MKNLLVGVCLGFLLSSLWNKHASAGQTQAEPARIWVGTELQLGMPKDSVITKVAEGGYEIKRATAIEGDYWTITKKNEKNEYDLVGTVTFRGGKLDWAEHTLYSSFDQSAAKFARNLYFALRAGISAAGAGGDRRLSPVCSDRRTARLDSGQIARISDRPNSRSALHRNRNCLSPAAAARAQSQDVCRRNRRSDL
ncbi:MAG TPA: hypothetical protein VHF01_13495 [Candidatus Acidoferrum sp.]|nr:hypothetical protein [Candidatus Acidoferrum sp.]